MRARVRASPVMLGDVAKRAVNLAVVFLALVAFFTVPFGDKTLFQHVRAVFSTEPAKEMGRAIGEKASDVKEQVKDEVTHLDGVAAPDAGK